MNYYERHIGDYLKDTSHLSLLEHGVYGRLLDVYYIREGAIPDALAARLIGARSKEEREALAAVLSEFFELIDGHWHQGRCNAEVEAYLGKQAEKGGSKVAAKERQRRARERRAQLFEALRSLGVTMPFKATTAELEAELSRAMSQQMSRSVTRDELQGVTRDDTATQTPDTIPHSPAPNTETESTSTSVAPMTTHPRRSDSTRAWQICRVMRKAGIADTNPGHPDLMALADAGVTDAEAIGAARVAIERGKGRFAYVLGTLKGQRIEAHQAAQQMHQGAMPQRQPTQAELNALAQGFATGVYGPATFEPVTQPQPETVYVESRLIAP